MTPYVDTLVPLLKMAQFISADELLGDSEEIDTQTKNMRKRMAANAYFTTYDYIYDKFVSRLYPS